MKEDGAKTRRLLESVEMVVEAHGRIRVNGAVASERTFRLQMEVMKTFARVLHQLGYLIEDARNLRSKHIDAVFDHWVLERDLAVKTLQNNKSRIKLFCKWIDKNELSDHVAQIETRYPKKYPKGFRVRTVADGSKSERGIGLDVDGLIAQAMELDSRYAAMLLLERWFGLRKKEALLIKPWRADKGDRLELSSAITKNGRPRNVSIREGAYGENQRKALDYAKYQCKRWEALSWPDTNLTQAERRYYHYNSRLGLTKTELGITGHGLRAGHAEDVMLLRGVIPPTLGGSGKMVTELEMTAARFDTTRTLGHNREEITGAYIGAKAARPNNDASMGHRLGGALFMPDKPDQHAIIWITEKPEPVEGVIGEYRLPAHKAQLAQFTVQVFEGEREILRQSLRQFLGDNAWAASDLQARLNLVGLDLASYAGEGWSV